MYEKTHYFSEHDALNIFLSKNKMEQLHNCRDSS